MSRPEDDVVIGGFGYRKPDISSPVIPSSQAAVEREKAILKGPYGELSHGIQRVREGMKITMDNPSTDLREMARVTHIINGVFLDLLAQLHFSPVTDLSDFSYPFPLIDMSKQYTSPRLPLDPIDILTIVRNWLRYPEPLGVVDRGDSRVFLHTTFLSSKINYKEVVTDGFVTASLAGRNLKI